MSSKRPITSAMLLLLLALAPADDLHGGDNELLSRAGETAGAVGLSGEAGRSISDDGRFIAFSSSAPNLLAGIDDDNHGDDVFLFDRMTGTRTLVSRSASSATQTGAGSSTLGAMSADGEWVVFASDAPDLTIGQTDTNGTSDVFSWNRTTDTVTLVSHAAGSPTTAANGASGAPVVSGDGAWVAFSSSATDLVASQTDGNGDQDVFLFDRSTGQTLLVSRMAGTTTTAASGLSPFAQVSADGRYTLFASSANDLVPGQTAGPSLLDLFLFDRIGATPRWSITSPARSTRTVSVTSSSSTSAPARTS